MASPPSPPTTATSSTRPECPAHTEQKARGVGGGQGRKGTGRCWTCPKGVVRVLGTAGCCLQKQGQKLVVRELGVRSTLKEPVPL